MNIRCEIRNGQTRTGNTGSPSHSCWNLSIRQPYRVLAYQWLHQAIGVSTIPAYLHILGHPCSSSHGGCSSTHSSADVRQHFSMCAGASNLERRNGTNCVLYQQRRYVVHRLSPSRDHGYLDLVDAYTNTLESVFSWNLGYPSVGTKLIETQLTSYMQNCMRRRKEDWRSSQPFPLVLCKSRLKVLYPGAKDIPLRNLFIRPSTD